MVNFKNYLASVRQKPLHQRVVIMWTGVTICSVIILIGWIWWMGRNVKIVQNNNPIVASSTAEQIQTLKDSLGTFLNQPQSNATTSATTTE